MKDFIRVIALPVVFAILNTVAEMILSALHGLSREGRTIKIIYRGRDNKPKEVHTEPADIYDFKDNHLDAVGIVDVDKLSPPNWLDRTSLHLNLMFVALGADASALFSPNRDRLIGTIAGVACAHFIIFLLYLYLNTVISSSEDEVYNRRINRRLVIVTLLVSIFSLVLLMDAL